MGEDEFRGIADPPPISTAMPSTAGRRDGAPPCSDQPLDRLARRNDRYERCDPGNYEDVCGMRFDFVAFAAEGLETAKAVKRALPGWTVLYWDKALDWFLAREPRNYVPARSEYEATLEDARAAVR